MPIKTTLLREGRVLLAQYTDPFIASEVLATVERLTRDIYGPAKKPMYSIADFTGITQLRLSMLSDGMKILRNRPSNVAHTALVTNSPVANGIANTLAQMLVKQNVVMYRSLNAAWRAVDELLARENDVIASKAILEK